MLSYSYHAHRFIYSHNAILFTEGTSRDHIKKINRWLEGGYICGNKVRAAPFYAQIKLRCDNYIDPQYYNPNAGTKSRRIFTVEICDICFEDDDIVSRDEINNKKSVGGK